MTRSGITPDLKAPSRSPLRRGAAVVGVLLALSMGGAAIVGTSQGLTIGPRDSPSYLSSAENLAAGLGYRTPYGDPGKPIDFEETTSPVVDFPPGYPTVLSLGVRMGADSRSTARVISALLVAGITLSVYLAARTLPLFRSGVAGAALVALIAGALTLPYTTSAMSEPLYGFLLILTLATATTYARDKQPLALVLATLLAAAATTVRTSGLALVGTLMVVAWLSLRGSRKRWFTPLAVGLVGVLPFYLSTALGNRVLAWHPPEIGSAKELLNGVAEWFIPPIGSPTFMVAAFAALVVGLLAWVRPWKGPMTRAGGGSSSPPLWSVALIAGGAHLGLLFVTKFLFSAQLSLGTRQLYPVGLSLLFAVVQYLGTRSETGGKRMAHGFVVLGICSLLATGWVAAVTLNSVVTGMRGFNSDGFLESETVDHVVGSIPGDHVFTNVPDGLWVAGLANTRPLPIVYDPLSLEDNGAMEEEMSRLADSIGDGAVLFYQLEGRDYMVDLSELRAIAPCEVVADSTAIVLAGTDHARCAGT
jgi:Dolichyl-phosphate-mannose-protein mannosyltransferase